MNAMFLPASPQIGSLLVALSLFAGKTLEGESAFAADPRIQKGATSKTASPLGSRPNIVLIVADNLGRESVGYYGREKFDTPYGRQDYLTPRLDQLADQGVVFENCLISTPLCGPARCAWNTGRHAFRVGMNRQCDRHRIFEEPDFGLPAEEVTLAELLRSVGYRTALFGKWNLGNSQNFNPLRHGFDEFYGSTLGNADYYAHTRHGKRGFFRNFEPVNDKGYFDALFTDEAVRFLHRREGSDQPFYMNLCFYAPHGPYQTPPGYKSGDRVTNYRNMVEYLDACVGRVLDALEQIGQARQTLVVFLGDQGGSSPNQYGRTLREESLKVICNARWPGWIPAGVRVNSPWMHYDLYASFAALAGVEVPNERVVDARNVWPLFEGKERPLDRTLAWTANENCFLDEYTQDAIRMGDWKLLIYRGKATGTDGLPKPDATIPCPTKIRGLYDLSKDPGERHDLASEHPEKVKQMQQAHARWKAECRAQQTLRLGDDS